MTNIIFFKSQAELSTEKNLEAFINLAKNQVKLWSSLKDFNWNNNHWPTHDKKIRFHNLKGRHLHRTKQLTATLTMSAPFIEFAKAYLRYSQQLKQTKVFDRTIAALLLLEQSLIELEGNSNVLKTSPRHLDRLCHR